jgi:RND superfamily putative drug exporter
MFERLARTCYRRRWRVLAAWVVLLIVLNVFASLDKGAFKNSFDIPGSDSQAAFDLLKQSGFSDRGGFTGQVVFDASRSIDDPAVKGAIEPLLTKLAHDVPNMSVVSPYSDTGQRQVAPGRHIAYAELNLADRNSQGFADATTTIRDDLKATHIDGVQLELGGFPEQQFGATELIGLVAAIVILLIAFGSMLAMGLPVLTALFGIGCGVAVVQLFANLVEMPDFTTQAASIIGIGVGIDYALFVVTRYRQSLDEGQDPEASVITAVNTAGRAVLFAGITVIIALLGMLSIGLKVPRGVAVGAALAVLFTMCAALTMLPAVLGFTGRNIDKLHVGRRKQPGASNRPSLWFRWSKLIQRRPWPAALIGVAILLALSSPVFSMRLGFSDAGSRPTTDSSRRAYDLLTKGFGPGFNGPFLLATQTPHGADDLATLARLSDTLNHTAGVQLASPPIPNADHTVAILQVFPTTTPQDAATAKLVHHLRDDVIPSVARPANLDVHVGGLTASSEDFAAFIGRRLPIFMAAVLALSFLLLMVVFRSLLVPLKAVIMNLLSIGAAYGAIVAVFQHGWGKSLVGLGKAGPVEAWAPMMLFAVVFGLSMDYEVFLLSRIREEYDRTGNNADAVAAGLAATARVITAAAAIMVCVFSTFILNADYGLKLFGLGLAVAVFVDATVVRLVLVPATMELLGDRNWWLPHWLDRILPVVHVEPPHHLDNELAALTATEGARTES